MPTPTKPQSRYRTAILSFLFIFIAASCAPAVISPAPVPLIQTVVVTREVTQMATHEVTSEVTQVVEVPVTNTPTPTLDQTATPSLTLTRTRIPSITPTWDPPRVEILSAAGTEKSACWYGPSTAYLYKYGLPDGVWMRVMGRNEDGSWVAVKAGDDLMENTCWIQATLVKFLSGSLKDLPVFWITLPITDALYAPPKAVSANRVGNEVTIFWQPVWMTEDDYRGYLVEAWVCQGGKQVFQPVGYVTTYNDNQKMIADKGIIAVVVIDEPGCDVPSRVRLYTVEKHGYTSYRMVPWPGFDAIASPTP